MKPILIALSLSFLAACAGGVVYKKEPPQPFKPNAVVQMRGSVSPADVYFTAVCLMGNQKTRVIVLGDMGIKLLDFQVTPTGKAEIYYKMPHLPGAFAQAFTRMAHSELLTVPAPRIEYKDPQTRLLFKAERAGNNP